MHLQWSDVTWWDHCHLASKSIVAVVFSTEWSHGLENVQRLIWQRAVMFEWVMNVSCVSVIHNWKYVHSFSITLSGPRDNTLIRVRTGQNGVISLPDGPIDDLWKRKMVWKNFFCSFTKFLERNCLHGSSLKAKLVVVTLRCVLVSHQVSFINF